MDCVQGLYALYLIIICVTIIQLRLRVCSLLNYIVEGTKYFIFVCSVLQLVYQYKDGYSYGFLHSLFFNCICLHCLHILSDTFRDIQLLLNLVSILLRPVSSDRRWVLQNPRWDINHINNINHIINNKINMQKTETNKKSQNNGFQILPTHIPLRSSQLKTSILHIIPIFQFLQHSNQLLEYLNLS